MVAIIAAVALVGAGALLYVLTRGSSTPAATSPVTARVLPVATPTTPAQGLSIAFRAAKGEGSVHVDVVNKLHGRIGRFSDDDGGGLGIQRISVAPGMRAEVRVVPGVTYFVANRAALTGYFGFPASLARRVAGKWLVLHPGESGYAQVTEGVTLASTMKEMTIRGPLKLLPARTLHGVKVVGIRGMAAGPTVKRGDHVTATLWVTQSGSHLPVLYRASSRKLGSTSTTFSRWGMHVSVASPPGL
jgi:hypothetical protein